MLDPQGHGLPVILEPLQLIAIIDANATAPYNREPNGLPDRDYQLRSCF